jgi:hypothetical protein
MKTDRRPKVMNQPGLFMTNAPGVGQQVTLTKIDMIK